MFQKKKDKRSIQSSEWIYQALKTLLAQKKYEDISVIDLVNEANIGRTTFYRNFSSIDDVLKERCEEVFGEFRAYCFQYYLTNLAEDKTFLTPFLRFWYDHSEIIELLIKAERINLLQEHLSQEITYFLNMSSVMENPTIANHLNYFVEMRVANSLSILTEWIKNDKNILPDDLAKIIDSQVKESIKLNLLF
ncbi:MAG: TetR/AcrR family transcriptional regulator [Erysipelotrichaceae bacterium]